jgi:hypothetical protein
MLFFIEQNKIFTFLIKCNVSVYILSTFQIHTFLISDWWQEKFVIWSNLSPKRLNKTSPRYELCNLQKVLKHNVSRIEDFKWMRLANMSHPYIISALMIKRWINSTYSQSVFGVFTIYRKSENKNTFFYDVVF